MEKMSEMDFIGYDITDRIWWRADEKFNVSFVSDTFFHSEEVFTGW